jgi:hypothetical protein
MSEGPPWHGDESFRTRLEPFVFRSEKVEEAADELDWLLDLLDLGDGAGLLEGVGFDDVEVYGDLDGSDYGPEADRPVVVARK